MNDMRASNTSSTKSGQRPRSANWGGSRANAGRKKKTLPTPSPSQAASAVGSVSHVNPVGHAGPSTLPSVAAEPSRVPIVGFFAPRLGMHLGQLAVPIGQSNDNLTPLGSASRGDAGRTSNPHSGSNGEHGTSPPRIDMR
jgi:hypothetical protein